MSSFLFNLNNGREALSRPQVVSGRSSYQIPLVVVQVQVSSESSSRCSEHSGETELRDSMSHSSLALGEPPFSGLCLYSEHRALTPQKSPSPVDGRGGMCFQQEEGYPWGVLPHEAGF